MAKCSFCQKGKKEVGRLFTGKKRKILTIIGQGRKKLDAFTRVHICDQCVTGFAKDLEG